MKTNELKKGDRIQLRNGWFGTLTDNARGNIREARVEGIYTETGSVYSHDILRACPQNGPNAGCWQFVDHTLAQLELRKTVEGIF